MIQPVQSVRDIAGFPPNGPVPIIDGPAAARLARRLRRLPNGGSQPRWTGNVVGLANDEAWPLAELLAARTGRPCRALARPEDALDAGPGDEPTTLLASSTLLTDAFVARLSHTPGWGLLTARDLAGLSALVAKTLLLPGTLNGRAVVVDASGESADGSLSTVDEVRVAQADGPDILTVTAHGRECLMHLDDGVICGRRPGGPAVLTPTGPSGGTSCSFGEGCYRLHYAGPPTLLPALDLTAAIVFTNSCMTLKVGTTQFPSDTALSLSLLESDAFALVGSPWVREGLPYAEALFRAALAAGRSLAGAVGVVNECIRHSERAIGPLALFGDAGLHPYGEQTIAVVSASAESAIAVPPHGTVIQGSGDELSRLVVTGPVRAARIGPSEVLVVPRGQEAASAHAALLSEPLRDRMDRLAAWADALTDLWVHDLRVDTSAIQYARTRLARAYPDIADGVPSSDVCRTFDQVERRLSAVDQDAVEQLLAHTTGSRFHFMDTYLPHSYRHDVGEDRCPECGGLAERYLWHHVTSSRIRRSQLMCPQCGEVDDVDPGSPLWIGLSGVRHARRGGTVAQTAVLRNAGTRPLRVNVAYALLYEELYGSSLARTANVTVPPGGEAQLPLNGSVPNDFDVVDRHGLRLFAVAEGRIATYSAYLWIAPEQPS